MLHACDQRFDVTENLEKILRTKQGLKLVLARLSCMHAPWVHASLWVEPEQWILPARLVLTPPHFPNEAGKKTHPHHAAASGAYLSRRRFVRARGHPSLVGGEPSGARVRPTHAAWSARSPGGEESLWGRSSEQEAPAARSAAVLSTDTSPTSRRGRKRMMKRRPSLLREISNTKLRSLKR